jgi:serine protease Do
MKQLLLALLFCCATLSLPGPAAAAAPDFVALSKELKPAVVNISTAKTVRPRRPVLPGPRGPQMDPFEEFFVRFFQGQPNIPRKERSLGSGFIISADGYILTNNHVVDGADEIKVKLADGHSFAATVKGTDAKLDLALLKIDTGENLPVAKLGDSNKLQVGEWVMAIGNPFGLEQTVTVGIVSAKGRVIGAGPYDDFIQTDASINPGNSGGPLFNTAGEVVGINTAIIAGGQGIGFATPVSAAQAIIPQLRETGHVTRGWLGVSVQPVTEELAASFGLDKPRGALVTEVIKGSRRRTRCRGRLGRAKVEPCRDGPLLRK